MSLVRRAVLYGVKKLCSTVLFILFKITDGATKCQGKMFGIIVVGFNLWCMLSELSPVNLEVCRINDRHGINATKYRKLVVETAPLRWMAVANSRTVARADRHALSPVQCVRAILSQRSTLTVIN